MKTNFLNFVLIGGLASSAAGQSTISTTDKYSYSANAGWIDFRSSAADGVVVSETCLSGKAYAANFGWIDLGNGSPANGHSYTNASATDFGVNLSASGALTGYGYCANVGWIAFEQRSGQPRFDFSSGKFTGFAYSANLGWIALDTPSSDLIATTVAIPDSDHDGIADAYEMFHFGNLTVMNATSNYDGDPATDLQEYVANTAPGDPASFLRITQQAYNPELDEVTLTFTSSANRLYSIEHDADLVGSWTASGLGWFMPDAGASTQRGLLFAAGQRRFFRVAARLPLQP